MVVGVLNVAKGDFNIRGNSAIWNFLGFFAPLYHLSKFSDFGHAYIYCHV